MRSIQYKMLTNVLNKIEMPDYIHAFEKNKSIPGMASLHVGKHCVISIDIKDFFHSIKQERVQQVFESAGIGIGKVPARVMSEICTYKSFVPQGALTSPKVSNLITGFTFGPLVKEYCDANGFILSIYADDITVSTDNKEINPKEVIQALTVIVQGFGFRINRKKTKVMFHGSRQWVCGAVVNAKVNLLVYERKKLRAIVHNVTKNGVSAEAAKTDKDPVKFLNHLRGRLNWFRQLNSNLGQPLYLKLKGHLAEVNAKAKEDAEVALLYKAYQEEAELIIQESDEEVHLPW